MKSDDEIISVFLILKNNCFQYRLGSENFPNKYIEPSLFVFYIDKINQRMKLR